MKYTVKYYANSVKIYTKEIEVEGDTQALYKEANKSWPMACQHAFFQSENPAIRMTRKGIIIQDKPQFFAAWYKKNPAILVMLGEYSEIHLYSSEKERDNILEMACTQKSAASVNPEPEPKDTIVSSEETNDSENGLIETKTSNGSATNVICLERQTPLNTVKSFGEYKSKDTGESTWKTTSKASPSKQSGKTWISAKIKPYRRSWGSGYPGFNHKMKKMCGKTFEFLYDKDAFHRGMYSDKEGNWIWKKEWLDFDVTPYRTTVASVSTRICGVVLSPEKISDRPILGFVQGICNKVGTAQRFSIAGTNYYDGHYYYTPTWFVKKGDDVILGDLRNMGIHKFTRYEGKQARVVKIRAGDGAVCVNCNGQILWIYEKNIAKKVK